MAEFCYQCLKDELHPEYPERNDFAGLCAPGETVAVLCEGHGPVLVDHDGRSKQEPPNERWCIGCSPDNCGGCR